MGTPTRHPADMATAHRPPRPTPPAPARRQWWLGQLVHGAAGPPNITAQLVYGVVGKERTLLSAVRQGTHGPYRLTPAAWYLGQALQRSGSRYL